MDYIKDMAFRFAMENGSLIAAGLVALVAVGMLLGSIKKMIAALFATSSRAGDSAAAQVMAKPKGLLLLGSMLGLALPRVVGRLQPCAGEDRGEACPEDRGEAGRRAGDGHRQPDDRPSPGRVGAGIGGSGQAEARASDLEGQVATARRSAEALAEEKRGYLQQIADLGAPRSPGPGRRQAEIAGVAQAG